MLAARQVLHVRLQLLVPAADDDGLQRDPALDEGREELPDRADAFRAEEEQHGERLLLQARGLPGAWPGACVLRAKLGLMGNWNSFTLGALIPFSTISSRDLRENTMLQSKTGENQM